MFERNIDKFNTKYRDKYRTYRENIIKGYAEKIKDEEEVYYIFGENSEDNNKVNATLYENGEAKRQVSIERDKLPENIEIDDLLINENGELYKDEETTKMINNELEDLVSNLQKEQEEEMKQLRLESHLYKVNEVGKDRIWLFDVTNDDEEEREEIEEMNISEEILQNVVPGDILVYKQGNYHLLSE